MVYAPFYFAQGLVDGILNTTVGNRLTADAIPDELPGGTPEWRIRFLPTLCPACGWDMQGQRDAHVLICRNCQSLWRPGSNRFERLGFARVTPRDDETVYLPFWRIRANVNGIALENYADLVRVANLPRAVQPGWEKRPFRFWAPAFKVRPGVLLRLARALTLAPPPEAMDTAIPEKGLYTANLPLKEALDTLKINLAGFLRPARRVPDLLPRIDIQPQKYRLVFLPFAERHHDLVNASLQLSVTKSHLRMAANL